MGTVDRVLPWRRQPSVETGEALARALPEEFLKEQLRIFAELGVEESVPGEVQHVVTSRAEGPQRRVAGGGGARDGATAGRVSSGSAGCVGLGF